MPSYLPFKHAIVKCSGILEFIIVFILGAKNRSRVRKVVQGFLWLVFPANIYAHVRTSLIKMKEIEQIVLSDMSFVYHYNLSWSHLRNYYKTYHSHAWNITFVPGDF